MDNQIEITWEELKVGDMFVDGSTVTDIGLWDKQVCYELKTAGSEIIASYTHLFQCEVRKTTGELVELDFKQRAMSDAVCYLLKIPIDNWICCEDISNLNDRYDIFMITNDDRKVKVESIKHVGDELWRGRVRCITTDKGTYQTGDFVSHNTGGKNIKKNTANWNMINNTFDAYSSSPIVADMAAAETTEQAREICFKGLKDQYEVAGVKMDDFNVEIIAKKLTSYKRTPGGLRLVEDGEKCDIVSIGSVGNMGNIFKTSELQAGYNYLTRPNKQEIGRDSAMNVII